MTFSLLERTCKKDVCPRENGNAKSVGSALVAAAALGLTPLFSPAETPWDSLRLPRIYPVRFGEPLDSLHVGELRANVEKRGS